MNIFAIYRCPVQSARHLVDSHVVKMVLESAQMLANCFSHDQLADETCPRTQTGTVRKYAHYNHPCSKWVRASRENMRWLIDHAIAMDLERIERSKLKSQEQLRLKDAGQAYNKNVANNVPAAHNCMPFIYWVQLNLQHSLVSEGPVTEFAQAMPDEFKCEDSVQAYRNFYITGKQHLHKWTQNKPDWITV
jgi:hypothetical protein